MQLRVRITSANSIIESTQPNPDIRGRDDIVRSLQITLFAAMPLLAIHYHMVHVHVEGKTMIKLHAQLLISDCCTPSKHIITFGVAVLTGCWVVQ
jgi:hypothetical protein